MPTDDICLAGQDVRPKGCYEIGMFQGVKSVNNLAHVLGVPSAAIACVKPLPNTPCTTKGCKFDAIDGNYTRCPAHRRNWYPLSNARGCDLLGPEFLRFSNKSRFRSCDCSLTSCSAAGYFPGDAIYIHNVGRNVVLSTPGLFSTERKKLLEQRKSKCLYLYPWHFFTDHLTVQNGKWNLKFSKKASKKASVVYKDLEGVSYSFPPPRNTIRSFLDENFLKGRSNPQDRWRETSPDSLPAWITQLVEIDKSNMSTITDKPAVYETNTASQPAEPTGRNVRIASSTPIDLHERNGEINTSPPLDAKYWKTNAQELARKAQECANELKFAKARNKQLFADNKRMKEEGERWLAGAKRKYDDMIATNKQQLEVEKQKVEKLDAKVAELEKKVTETCRLLEHAKQKNDQPSKTASVEKN